MSRIIDRRSLQPRISPRWEPKKWQPQYDEIIILSIHGVSNISIAERYQLTPQQVSNILNCEEGKRKIEEERKKSLEQMQNGFTNRLDRLAGKALTVAEKVLERDGAIENMIENHPLSLINNMMGILKATGKVIDKVNPAGNVSVSQTIQQNNITVNQQTNNIQVPIAVAERVNSGLAMLNEIDRIHKNNVNSESAGSK